MNRTLVLPCVFMISCLLLCPLNLAAQTPEAPQVDVQAIAAQWPNLSAADFVKEIVDSRAERFQWEPEVLEEYRVATYAEAARRLQSGQAVPLEHLVTLAEWASYALELPQQQALGAQLLQQLQANSSVDAVQAVYRAHRKLHAPIEARTTIVTQWLQGKDLSQLPEEQQSWFEQVEELASSAWPSKTITDFVKEVNESREERYKWHSELLRDYRTAAYQEAARRLLDDGPLAPEDAAALDTLAAWAKRVLTPEEIQQIQASLVSQVRGDNNASFAQLQGTYRAQKRLGGPLDERVTMTKEWLARRDLASLPVAELDWCARALGIADGYVNQGMHIHWTGTIRPPHDGQYTFSASPTQIQIDYPYLVSKTSTKVFIGEQLVLDASGEEVSSQPVQLSANQPSPVRIEFDYQHSGNRAAAPHPPSAILYWEGPGIVKQLVPSVALAPAQGDGPGLWGEYTAVQPSDSDGNPQQPLTATGVDPQVDFLWTSAYSFLLRDREALDAVVEAFVDKATATEYLAELRESMSGGTVRWWVQLAEYMTSAQRARLLRALADEPQILQRTSPGTLLRILHALRVGAEDEAIDLIGNWAQAHGSDPPRLALNYYSSNRQIYYWIADHFTYEFNNGCDRLEEEFLELPDGGCAVPAAYIVAYSRGFRGQLEEWIAALDTKLDDNSLSGDARASWLLARAQAEEISGNTGPQDRLERFPERYHAGWGYLNEASLTADSEAMKLRIFEEKLTRAAAAQQYDTLQEQLQSAAQLPSPESQERVASLAEEIAKLRQDQEQRLLAQQIAAQARYVKELQRRQKRAKAANDSQSVARYGALIEAAQPQEQNP